MNDFVYRDAVVHLGDARQVLSELSDGSVDCVVTSPPYWGLRDYGTGSWTGGDPDHEHDTRGARGGRGGSGTLDKRSAGAMPSRIASKACSCGAVREDSQLGLEGTPEEYIERLEGVFAEVFRVLAKSGTCWLNLGDSYANDGKWGGQTGGRHAAALHGDTNVGRGKRNTGLKQKELVGIPWRAAFALQKAGWYLRCDVIWDKPNAMPDPTADRPTRSHEYLFMLTKSPRYFYDAEKLYEPCTSAGGRQAKENEAPRHGLLGARASGLIRAGGSGEVRNGRSIWSINTQPYKGAHFAVMPDELAGRCILAGCPRGGTVLDLFAGSGTTLAASLYRHRKAVGIELNPEYLPLIRRRCRKAFMSRGWGLTY